MLATGQPVLDQAVGQLPTRRGRWLLDRELFPHQKPNRKSDAGRRHKHRSYQTKKKLEECVHKLAGSLLHTQTKDNFWLARELTDAINQYHAALAMSLDLLIRQPEKNTELLPQNALP